MKDDRIDGYLRLAMVSVDEARAQHADKHPSAAKSNIAAALSAVGWTKKMLDRCIVVGPPGREWVFHRLIRESEIWLKEMGENITNPDPREFSEACGEVRQRLDQLIRMAKNHAFIEFPGRNAS